MARPQYFCAGGGLTALAAAFLLYRERGVPAGDIHVLENPDTEERGLLGGRVLTGAPGGALESLLAQAGEAEAGGTARPALALLRRALMARGVDFSRRGTVYSMDFEEAEGITVTALHYRAGLRRQMVQLHEGDCCLWTAGRCTDCAASGDLALPALWRPGRPEAFGMWERLARRKEALGDGAPFTVHPRATAGAALTLALGNGGLARAVERAAGRTVGGGALLPLGGSPWGLTAAVDPDSWDTVRAWGTRADARGAFVPKPMRRCSGREMAEELLGAMGLWEAREAYLSAVRSACVTVLPYLTAQDLDCARPPVRPAGSENLFLLGPFTAEGAGKEPWGDRAVLGARRALRRLPGQGQ